MSFKALVYIVFSLSVIFLCKFVYNNYSVVNRQGFVNQCSSFQTHGKKDKNKKDVCNFVNISILHSVLMSDDSMYEYNMYHKKFFKRILTDCGFVNVLAYSSGKDSDFNSTKYFDIPDDENKKIFIKQNRFNDDVCDKRYIIIDTDHSGNRSVEYFDNVHY